MSLTYAFGRMGRHIRTIAHEARAFVGAKFRSLEPTQLRDYLVAQYFAIDLTLFSVFYNEEPTDPLYLVHKKYGSKLLGATESDFRRLGRAYAFSLLAAQSQSTASDGDIASRMDLLHVLSFIYTGSQAPQLWIEVLGKPDASMISAALCHDIAAVLQMDPGDKPAFSDDWLSLVSAMIAATNSFLAKEDWSRTAATMIESIDFGGTQA